MCVRDNVNRVMRGPSGPEASNVNLSISKSALEPSMWFIKRELSMNIRNETEVAESAIEIHLDQSVHGD